LALISAILASMLWSTLRSLATDAIDDTCVLADEGMEMGCGRTCGWVPPLPGSLASPFMDGAAMPSQIRLGFHTIFFSLESDSYTRKSVSETKRKGQKTAWKEQRRIGAKQSAASSFNLDGVER
jgi:hypothetical protein